MQYLTVEKTYEVEMFRYWRGRYFSTLFAGNIVLLKLKHNVGSEILCHSTYRYGMRYSLKLVIFLARRISSRYFCCGKVQISLREFSGFQT